MDTDNRFRISCLSHLSHRLFFLFFFLELFLFILNLWNYINSMFKSFIIRVFEVVMLINCPFKKLKKNWNRIIMGRLSVNVSGLRVLQRSFCSSVAEKVSSSNSGQPSSVSFFFFLSVGWFNCILFQFYICCWNLMRLQSVFFQWYLLFLHKTTNWVKSFSLKNCRIGNMRRRNWKSEKE